MHILANEPSIGLYHVSNHITRNVPKCVELRVMSSLCSSLNAFRDNLWSQRKLSKE